MEHNVIPAAERHAAHAWEFDDEAERVAATGLSSGDLYKLALQKDTDELYVLVATTPVWHKAGTSKALAQKAVFVNSRTGSDAEGLRERADKPFKTVAAANAAAVSGDMVLLEGRFTEALHVHANVIAYMGIGQGAVFNYTGAGVYAGDNNQVRTCLLSNLAINKTGSDLAFYVQKAASVINCINVTASSDTGYGAIAEGTLRGLTVTNSGVNEALAASSTGVIEDCKAYATGTGAAISNNGVIRRCYANATGNRAIINYDIGSMYSCEGHSSAALVPAVLNYGRAYTSSGYSTAQTGWLNLGDKAYSNGCKGFGIGGAGFVNGASGSTTDEASSDSDYGESTTDEGYVNYIHSFAVRGGGRTNVAGLEGFCTIGGRSLNCSGSRDRALSGIFPMSVFNGAEFGLGDTPGTLIECSAWTNTGDCALIIKGNGNRIIGGSFVNESTSGAQNAIRLDPGITGTEIIGVKLWSESYSLIASDGTTLSIAFIIQANRQPHISITNTIANMDAKGCTYYDPLP